MQAFLHILKQAGGLHPGLYLKIENPPFMELVDSIVQMEPLSHGEFELLLKDGSHPRVSRTYRQAIERRLGQRL